ncbi:MAG: aspartate aminotransferase family protein [Actinobacteria bacterium]|nr:aspartate aminotransferase family protein [Actinomycetota bacterium]
MSPVASDQYQESKRLHDASSRYLAGGVSTAFRMFERPVPLVCESAEGSSWTDVDGNRYIDFVCGYGPVILGHSDPEVCEAAGRAAASVQQVGGQHREELELAELLCQHVPCFEMVRISLSGSEAVHGAIRLARGVTGRSLVVKFAGHYHGWLDGAFTGIAHPPPGLPESAGQPHEAIAGVVVVNWNEPEAIKDLFARAGDRIAAVIMEPLPCNQGVLFPEGGYLELVRELTESAGAILIFDEVITGFRIGLGGAQERFGVIPDLTVVAKAMGNGFPVSALGGRAELMEAIATNTVVHAGTYNGGGVSVAASLATLKRLSEDVGVHERMVGLGGRLMAGLEQAAANHGLSLVTAGPGPVFFAWFSQEPVRSFEDHLNADGAMYARFAEAMLARGVRIIPAGRWYLTTAHDEDDVDRALEAADDALAGLS